MLRYYKYIYVYNFISLRLVKSRLCDPQLFINCTRKRASGTLGPGLFTNFVAARHLGQRRIAFNAT